jgi:small multidrug resistance pump
MTYLYLTIAIVSEVIATSALKAAQGFTNPVPSLIVVAGYVSAFYFLSVVVKSMHLGVAYRSGAAWALCWWHSPASSSTSKCRICLPYWAWG